MRPGTYVAVSMEGLPQIYRVLSCLPDVAVLESVHTGRRLFYKNYRIYEEREGKIRFSGEHVRTLVIPPYLESQVLSNAIQHWAQTLLDERALARSKDKR